MSALLHAFASPASTLHVLVLCVLLAAGMGLCLYLFITLKREIAGLLHKREEDRRQIDSLATALEQARAEARAVEADLREVEKQTGMLVPPQPARSGLNLSKRTQVLRMHRGGHDNAGIASALALPRAEVDLLIKVHRIVVDQVASG